MNDHEEMKKNDYKYSYQRAVAFKDTDMAGVVHFTQVLAYAEEAEHAALSERGVAPISGEGGFPKVNIECDYYSPIRFGDKVVVNISIVNISNSSLVWAFEMQSATPLDGETRKFCSGKFVTVFLGADGKPQSIGGDFRVALGDLILNA